MASSASAVAMVGESPDDGQGRFLGGVPPGPLRAIPQPKPISGGGCDDWQPAAEAPGDFVVATDDLVASGRGTCQTGTSAARQPLFVRGLPGGHWRVLRWLAGDAPPMLATAGRMLAVGVQLSAVTMEVFLIDIRTGDSESHFDMPDGYLAFATPRRLMVSVPQEADGQTFPLGPRMRLGGGTYSREGISGPFGLWLYSIRGRRIAQLGTSEEPPLVSDGHFITDEDANGDEVLSVQSIQGGMPKAVIGFDSPARALVTFAFRWPALVTVQTTSTPLLPSEVHCWSGGYGPASQAFLGTFDLQREEPFIPAPALTNVQASEPLANCGPAPP